MRKYPQVKKITDFDLLECLTHDQAGLTEKGIITTIFYQTKNYQLLSRYYLYKNKIVISIHDRTGYTMFNPNEVCEHELFEIFNFIKSEGMEYILKVINGSITQEIHFTGCDILGAYMQVYFRYIMKSLCYYYDKKESELNLYCTTFQTGNIFSAATSLSGSMQNAIINLLKRFTLVSNLELAEHIRLFIREVKDSYPYFLPPVLLFKSSISNRLFDEFLLSKYEKEYKNISIFKKIFNLMKFKPIPSYQEYKNKQIYPVDNCESSLEKIEDYAENIRIILSEYTADLISTKKIEPVVHSRNISLIKDNVFIENKMWIKSNKYAISYPIQIEKKVPLEFFYLFLNDYTISSNNKLNIDILTAIFRDYLYFTYEDDGLIPSDLITYKELTDTTHNNIDLFTHWLNMKFGSTKLSDIINIIKSNNTNPFHTHRYNKITYCIVGSELAFDYYYKLIDLLEIEPHCILKIKKEN